jgi:hypothetical protein
LFDGEPSGPDIGPLTRYAKQPKSSRHLPVIDRLDLLCG